MSFSTRTIASILSAWINILTLKAPPIKNVIKSTVTRSFDSYDIYRDNNDFVILLPECMLFLLLVVFFFHLGNESTLW